MHKGQGPRAQGSIFNILWKAIMERNMNKDGKEYV